MQRIDPSVSLKVLADIAWLPLVQSVVEHGAPVLGLDPKNTLRLTMATEELLMHLARTAPGTKIEFSLKPGTWHVMAEFAFTADPSGLWAMNLAAAPDGSFPDNTDHLGLLLASRLVDEFTLRLAGKTVHLCLRKDRDYPTAMPVSAPAVQPKGRFTIARDMEPALIKAACIQALGVYPAQVLPQCFSTPDKVVDMVAAKDLTMAVAVDGAGALAGVICWHVPSEQSIGFWGPYLFSGAKPAASLLTEHLINYVARTRAMGLFSEMATADLPVRDFEPLGSLLFTETSGKQSHQPVWYRHLREDMGASVWAHPAMVPYLENVYREQLLMRDIRVTDGPGGTLPDRSVFSGHLRPELGEATLFPMVTGKDAADCVASHVALLCREKFCNIFFRLDLAHGWQAALGGVLMENGFSPRLVLPYGGTSDVVVLQHG